MLFKGEFNLWWGESYRWNFSRWRDKQIYSLCGHSPRVGKTFFWWLGMLNFYCSQQNVLFYCLIPSRNQPRRTQWIRLLWENIVDGKHFENSFPKKSYMFYVFGSTLRIYCYFVCFFFILVTTHALTSSFEYSLLLVSSWLKLFLWNWSCNLFRATSEMDFLTSFYCFTVI